MKFTQEIKDKWLEALKSGKYVQGYIDLVKDTEEGKRYCCIGVLGEICDFLDNSLNGQDEKSPYSFLRLTIGKDETENLWRTNDEIRHDVKHPNDYSNVIPLIENLPVEK